MWQFIINSALVSIYETLKDSRYWKKLILYVKEQIRYLKTMSLLELVTLIITWVEKKKVKHDLVHNIYTSQYLCEFLFYE
jgi:hypothetical protein